MAGVKISNLPAIAAPAVGDIFPVVQGGVTYKETITQLNSLLKTVLVTPANGGIVYTDATQLQLLAPTVTARQLLTSGASSAPVWSTSTYPLTNTINTLLYASSANTMAALPTGNSGVLITSAGGVPSISSTLPSAVQSNITQLGTQAAALNMGSHQINNVTDPTSAQDAATKAYVDSVAQGLTIQGACRVATTGALTATYSNGSSGVSATLTNSGAFAALVIDGVTLAVNDRVLVKNQASTLQNGIYTATILGDGVSVNWVMTRATDYDQAAEINPGDLVLITAGTVNTNSSWVETATVVTIGTDPISFSQFSAALPISLANGGTGAALVASNGGIFYSTATTGAILAGTATAGRVLQSGASTTPGWSTPTYPSASGTAGKILRSDGTNNVYSTSTFADTYTASNLLYSNSANTVTGLATANNGVLKTDGSGVPSISSTLPAALNVPQPNIIGTTTNDNAAAGSVGEYIVSQIPFASAVGMSNGVITNITSISLTAGDWDVTGLFNGGSSVIATAVVGAISITSATLPDSSLTSSNVSNTANLGRCGLACVPIRLSLSGTTTVYLVGQVNFGSGAGSGCGIIQARRRR